MNQLVGAARITAPGGGGGGTGRKEEGEVGRGEGKLRSICRIKGSKWQEGRRKDNDEGEMKRNDRERGRERKKTPHIFTLREVGSEGTSRF